MTPEVTGYADRIATGAAADGVPWRLPRQQAESLGARYGVELDLGDGEHTLRDVAARIAAELLQASDGGAGQVL